MYRDKSIAVVVPCYNEAEKITAMLDEIPIWVDVIYVVDDCSRDASPDIIRRRCEADPRVKLLSHTVNRGVGAAIATGYKKALENEDDVTVVMAADGQMDPDDLPALLDVIVDDKADYAKGNRFFTEHGVKEIPKVRLLGNLLLSAFTKIVSGYWHVSDTQCGYTAINLDALAAMDLDNIYPRYGCPNDILTRLNVANMRVMEVPVVPRYGANWTSKMRVTKVMLPI